MTQIITVVLLCLSINLFSQDLFPYFKKGKFGYINEKKEIIIKPQYSFADIFSDGFAVVCKKNSYNLINEEGIIVFDNQADIQRYSNGFAVVAQVDKYGLINKDQKIIVDYKYEYINQFIDGYAKVIKKNTRKDIFGNQSHIVSLIGANGELFSNHWFSSIIRKSDSLIIGYVIDKAYKISVIDGSVSQLDSNETNKIKSKIKEDKTPAVFPGGWSAYNEFFEKRVSYPRLAEKKGIQGVVKVAFNISSEGKVVDVEIIDPLEPSLNREAVRVIGLMPKWAPATLNGEKIKSLSYLASIRFRLRNYY